MLSSKELNLLTRNVIGCAINVHRQLGPGLLESLYEEAMCVEFDHAKILVERQKKVPVVYRGKTLPTALRLDLVVRNTIIVEVKAVDTILPVHEAQLLSYMRLSNIDSGLLINFNVTLLKSGIRRKTLRPLQASQSTSVSSVSSVPSVLR